MKHRYFAVAAGGMVMAAMVMRAQPAAAQSGSTWRRVDPSQLPGASGEPRRTWSRVEPKTASPVAAGPAYPRHWRLGFRLTDFNWKEFEEGGAEAVDESGSLVGLAVHAEHYRWGRTGLRFDGQIYTGTVDYDGQTTGGGTPIPVQSETEYVGLWTDAGLTRRFADDGVKTFDGFGQLGFRMWNRSLQGVGTIRGYDEFWVSIGMRLGLSGTYRQSPDLLFFGDLGLRLPLHTSNEADFSELGGVNPVVEPKEQTAVFLEAGAVWRRFFASLSFTRVEYDASDWEITSLQGRLVRVRQPESENALLSLTAGMAW